MKRASVKRIPTIWRSGLRAARHTRNGSTWWLARPYACMRIYAFKQGRDPARRSRVCKGSKSRLLLELTVSGWDSAGSQHGDGASRALLNTSPSIPGHVGNTTPSRRSGRNFCWVHLTVANSSNGFDAVFAVDPLAQFAAEFAGRSASRSQMSC